MYVQVIKNTIKFLLSRVFIVSILIILQIAVVYTLFYQIAEIGLPVFVVFEVIGLFTSLIILNRHFNPAYKISWIFLILIFPIIGVGFYIMFGRARLSKKKAKSLSDDGHNNFIIDNDPVVLTAIQDRSIQKMANFIEYATDSKFIKHHD
jgi:cardiolipin synthase